MFHSYLRTLESYKHSEIYSAGTKGRIGGIRDLTKSTLLNHNIDCVKEKSNSVDEYLDIVFDEIYILDKKIKIDNKIPQSRKYIKSFFKDPFDCDATVYNDCFISIKKFIKETLE